METTYTWELEGTDRTRMTLRNRGNPTGFARLTAPMMKLAMSAPLPTTSARLKALLESSEASH